MTNVVFEDTMYTEKYCDGISRVSIGWLMIDKFLDIL